MWAIILIKPLLSGFTLGPPHVSPYSGKILALGPYLGFAFVWALVLVRPLPLGFTLGFALCGPLFWWNPCPRAFTYHFRVVLAGLMWLWHWFEVWTPPMHPPRKVNLGRLQVWLREGNNLSVGADAAIASPPIVDLTLCSISQFVQRRSVIVRLQFLWHFIVFASGSPAPQQRSLTWG